MDSIREIGDRLHGRGRLGAALADYLASRLDLLNPVQATEIAQRSSVPVAAPFGDVQRRFAEDFGRRIEDAFASFDSEPFEVGVVFQWHRARLGSGESVVCKTRHPEIEIQLRAGRKLLALVEAELIELPWRWTSAQRSRLARDFVQALESALDLRREADDLVTLGARFEVLSLVTVPAVYLTTSGERFLTTADLGGSTLAEAAGQSENDRRRSARRVCRAWLRGVLLASKVPVALEGRGALLLANGKVAFCSGPFQTLPGRLRELLERYLSATAIEDHESLVEAWAELGEPISRAGERRLLHAFRHTEPFRDGAWEPESDALASRLLTRWQQALVLGSRPRPECLSFMRGLGMLTRQTAALAPGASPFNEAFQEVRLHELFAESARLSVGGVVMPLVALPRKLDRALRRTSQDRGRSRRRNAQDRDGASSWSMTVALLLALAAVGLLVHYLAPLSGAPVWIERAGFVAMLALGGSLLRLA